MNISKRLAVVAFAATAFMTTTAFAGPGGPGAPVILYDTVYYSDATHTVEVGRNYGVCYGGWGTPIWAGASQFTDGQTTAHYENVRVGRCTADGPILE
ncbi:hypothetical protein D3C85_1514540 [compost metagenome]